jgi:hypothetical protein
MQAVPESRQQTFEEIYGPPENFLEIEVRNNNSHPESTPLYQVTDKSDIILAIRLSYNAI